MKKRTPILSIITVIAVAFFICIALTPTAAAKAEALGGEMKAEQTDKVYYCGENYLVKKDSGSKSIAVFKNFSKNEGEFVNSLYSALTFKYDGAPVNIAPESISFEGKENFLIPQDYDVVMKFEYGGKEHEVRVKITLSKAPLRVKALINGSSSAELTEGEQYDIEVVYEGFVGKDDKDSSLTSQGIIVNKPKMPTDGFKIVPAYAASDYYEMVYVGADIVIKANPQPAIEYKTGDTSVCTLMGSFSPCYSLEFLDVGISFSNENYAAISQKLEQYYRSSGVFDDYKQVGAYKIGLQMDGNRVEITDPIRVRLKIDDKFTGKKDYRLIHFAPDGSTQILTATEREGYITFNTVDLGEYVLLIPIEGANVSTIVGICVAIVVVLILVALFFTIFRSKY